MKSTLLSVLLTLFFTSALFAQPSDTVKNTSSKTETATVENPSTTVKTDGNSSPAVQTQTAYVRPDSKTRFRRYVNSVVGPVALARTTVSAGFSTWRNSPEEWGESWEGFGRRFASNFGRSAIRETAIYGLDEGLKYDSRFYRSQKKGFGARLGNALISPVTARDKNGKRVIGVPRLVGTYSASIIAAEAWYPDRYDYRDGLANGTISLGINAAFNVFREFIWKK